MVMGASRRAERSCARVTTGRRLQKSRTRASGVVLAMNDHVCEFAWRKDGAKPPPDSHTLSFCAENSRQQPLKDRRIHLLPNFFCRPLESSIRISLIRLHFCATEFRSYRDKLGG